MFRLYLLTLLSFIFGIANAQAYEFKKLNAFFTVLEKDYSYTPNLKQIAVSSLQDLSLLDGSLSFYSSDSQAFLYHNRNLIGTFEFPEKLSDSAQWQEFFTEILDMSIKRSVYLKNQESKVESYFLEKLTSHLDPHSRIEKQNFSSSGFTASIQNSIIYIRPDEFSEGTSAGIKDLILSVQNGNGVILDLRGCRGGSLNEALMTAGLFLDKAIIGYSLDKNNHYKYYTSSAGDILDGKPLAVLTDNRTASAAELIAAALLEQSRATLIGTQTYGKNSIQNLYKVNDKIIFLTSGHFFTPTGKSLEQQGIIPQICTGINNSCTSSDVSNPNKDIQIAVNYIKKKLG